jgi:glycosyltransferase involved in cell wall biosynthesis
LESSEKFLTLPNGYDKEEFCISGESREDPGHKLRIVHTGKLGLERSPRPLLIALRRLLDENPALEQVVEVYLVGEIGVFNDGKTIEHYLDEFHLRSVVKLTGHVPQLEAIRYQTSADILVLIIGIVPPEDVSTYGIASKVFDYMLAGRPVLTIADPGPVSALVEKTQIGPAFAPSEIDQIQGYLSDALRVSRTGQLNINPNRAEIEKYDFRQLTALLVERFSVLT